MTKYTKTCKIIIKKNKNMIEEKSLQDTMLLQAKLIENVQFIYELALAELELEALGAKFTVTNGLREFLLDNECNPNTLLKRLAYFKTIDGKATDYYKLIKYNRTKSVNQYLTHWIYPYKGKFHPQMIRALLNILKLAEGDKSFQGGCIWV